VADAELLRPVRRRIRRTSRRRGIYCLVAGPLLLAQAVFAVASGYASGRPGTVLESWIAAAVSAGAGTWAIGYGVLCLRGKRFSPEARRLGREWSWARWIWWPLGR
jgi:hypothetical protein